MCLWLCLCPCLPHAAAFSYFTLQALSSKFRQLGDVQYDSSAAVLGGGSNKWGGLAWRQSLPFTSYAAKKCTPASWVSTFSFSASAADTGGLLFFVTRDHFGRVEARAPDGGASGLRVPRRASVSIEFDNLENAGTGDVNGNHVGVNVGATLRSSTNSGTDPSCAPLLAGAGPVFAWVEYSGPARTLYVYVADTSTKPSVPALVHRRLDLCFGSNQASAYAVGFFAGRAPTAATATYRLLSWQFAFQSKALFSPLLFFFPNSSACRSVSWVAM